MSVLQIPPDKKVDCKAMMRAKLITASSKCSVRVIKKKRDNSSVDADFHAVKGHQERSTCQAGLHQTTPTSSLSGSARESIFPMTLTPEDTTGSVVGQEGGDEQEFGKAE